MATEPSLGPGRQPRLENSGASSTLTSGSAFRGASAPGTLTSGSAFRTPQPFGKNNTPIAASVEAQKAKEAEEARTYKVSPLSDDEWSKLTTSQQRAVAEQVLADLPGTGMVAGLMGERGLLPEACEISIQDRGRR